MRLLGQVNTTARLTCLSVWRSCAKEEPSDMQPATSRGTLSDPKWRTSGMKNTALAVRLCYVTYFILFIFSASKEALLPPKNKRVRISMEEVVVEEDTPAKKQSKKKKKQKVQ